MKKLIPPLTISILILASLSACTVRGPSVRVIPPSVEIDGYGRGYDSGYRNGNPGIGNKCPPGQAKKGRC